MDKIFRPVDKISVPVDKIVSPVDKMFGFVDKIWKDFSPTKKFFVDQQKDELSLAKKI